MSEKPGNTAGALFLAYLDAVPDLWTAFLTPEQVAEREERAEEIGAQLKQHVEDNRRRAEPSG